MATIQDLIDGFLLRTTSHSELTTKGSQLTFAEGDTVFITIYEFLKDMISGASLTPYNSGTTYTGTTYVSYSGNIYVHISGTPTTGVTPGTNPAKWELSSVGALMHVRNQDTHLAAGTSDEVSAADLRVLLDSQYIVTDTAHFQTTLSAGTLSENSVYAIDDIVASSGILLIKSLGGSSFSPNGVLLVRMPKYSSTSGIWNHAGTYAVNSYVIYSSEVYKNLTGSNSSTTPPDSDGTNWQLQDRTTSSRYENQFFGVVVGFDGSAFTIYKSIDRKYANENGALLTSQFKQFVDNGDYLMNKCDSGSDCGGLINLRGSVSGNTLTNSSIAVLIGGNLYGSGFSSNTLRESAIVYTGNNDGEFVSNIVEGTSLQFDDGHDTSNSITGCRFSFSPAQTIKLRSNANITGKTITKDGSNVQDTIVMTGLATVNLALNGDPDVYGEIILSSTNPTETVSAFSNGARIFPIKIMPESGLTVTLSCTAHGSVSAHGQIIAPSSSYTINGSKGDYVILEPITVGSYNVYRVKSTSIVL